MTAPPSTSRRQGKARQRKLSAVILAAGVASRFSGTKQLAEIGGKALIRRVIDAIPEEEVREIVVVLGHDAASISSSLDEKGLRIVVNRNYRDGMSSSIRAGIFALAGGSQGAMLLLADQPFITKALIRRMIKLFEAESAKARIVAIAHGDVVSPPAIFSRKYFRELAALGGDQGAKFVILRHSGEVSLVKVRSKAVFADVDTRADLAAVRRLLLEAGKTR